MSFGLVMSTKKVRSGNQLPYDHAVGVGERRSLALVAALNDLSLELYSGQLQCEMAAGRGVGHRESLNQKAIENTLLNRIRGGDRGMGIAIVCLDALSGRSVVIHPRVRRKKSQLGSCVLTTESGCEDCCLLAKHLVMPVLANRFWESVLYGLCTIQELARCGLLNRYKKRKTFISARLNRVPLRDFLGGHKGFGLRGYKDAVGTILDILKEGENTC